MDFEKDSLPENLNDNAWFDNLIAGTDLTDSASASGSSEADDSWIDSILSAPELHEEIIPAEEAMQDAGLVHPNDVDVDRIIQEALSENWGGETAVVPSPVQPVLDETESTQDDQPAHSDGEPFKDDEFRDTFGEGEGLAEVFADEQTDAAEDEETEESESDEEEEDDTPVRKRRPKHKKGYGLFGLPHVVVTAVWLAICLIIGITLGRMLWVCAADVLAFGREDQDITITITEDDTIDSISVKLKNAGLIRYSELFKFYADFSHAEEKISAGTFTLNSLYDYHALVSAMRPHSAARQVVEVMVPEGYTCAQIFKLLEDKGVCSAEKLADYAANGELDDYWFLEGVERGTPYCLEGYLFPDTYKFYSDDDPERVLEKFLDDFNYRFTDIMKAKLETLNERLSSKMASHGYDSDYISSHLMTVREITIIASMIEKEKANTLDGYGISSVIYNRLCNQREYPYLNIDATIVYALSLEGIHRDDLTLDDLAIDSPYNSYTRTGLTPGPISNPGQSSLDAALDPNTGDYDSYYYYAYNPKTGEHHFSRTLSEQTAFLDSIG